MTLGVFSDPLTVNATIISSGVIAVTGFPQKTVNMLQENSE